MLGESKSEAMCICTGVRCFPAVSSVLHGGTPQLMAALDDHAEAVSPLLRLEDVAPVELRHLVRANEPHFPLCTDVNLNILGKIVDASLARLEGRSLMNMLKRRARR